MRIINNHWMTWFVLFELCSDQKTYPLIDNGANITVDWNNRVRSELRILSFI